MSKIKPVPLAKTQCMHASMYVSMYQTLYIHSVHLCSSYRYCLCYPKRCQSPHKQTFSKKLVHETLQNYKSQLYSIPTRACFWKHWQTSAQLLAFCTQAEPNQPICSQSWHHFQSLWTKLHIDWGMNNIAEEVNSMWVPNCPAVLVDHRSYSSNNNNHW